MTRAAALPVAEPAQAGEALLEVQDLRIGFPTRTGLALAVDGVSFNVRTGESIALVGESGSGKSLTLRAILGLLRRSPAVVSGGSIHYRGQDLLAMPEKQQRSVRSSEIAMVSQDVLGSLHPLYTIGWQISEAIRIHNPQVSRARAHERAVELLDRVGIANPRRRVDDYPYSFSGVCGSVPLSRWPSRMVRDCCSRTSRRRPWTPRSRLNCSRC